MNELPKSRTITLIKPEGTGYWTVYEGDLNSRELCWDEMLGQVMELTHPSLGTARYAMRTDQEWIDLYGKRA